MSLSYLTPTLSYQEEGISKPCGKTAVNLKLKRAGGTHRSGEGAIAYRLSHRHNRQAVLCFNLQEGLILKQYLVPRQTACSTLAQRQRLQQHGQGTTQLPRRIANNLRVVWKRHSRCPLNAWLCGGTHTGHWLTSPAAIHLLEYFP